jgi:hypothetical protein
MSESELERITHFSLRHLDTLKREKKLSNWTSSSNGLKSSDGALDRGGGGVFEGRCHLIPYVRQWRYIQVMMANPILANLQDGLA